MARELEVHVLAANAGAELGPMKFDEWEAKRILANAEDVRRQWGHVQLSAGWAAWYASGDELL